MNVEKLQDIVGKDWVITKREQMVDYLNDAVLNVARMLHPYDFCIACAVHVVTPDGKELVKFQMDTDGKITKYPVDSE